MAKILDPIFLVVFGAWAYTVAKRKYRDEVGWAFVAALSFFLPGYIVQEAIFPKLAESLGWPETWQKPSGFIVGGVCALVVNLVLTFVVKPLPKPDSTASDEPPKAGGAAGGDAEQEKAGEGAPPGAEGDEPKKSDPLAFLARYWPTVVIVAMYGVTQFKGVTEWLSARGYEPPYPPVREMLLPALVAAQAWILSRSPSATAIAAFFCVAFLPALNAMEWRWSRGSSYYSHGYLVPFVAWWLVSMKRKRLAALKPSGDMRGWGLGVLVFGLLLLLGGAFIRANTVQAISFVIVLCGIVFFLFGRAISKTVLFPLLFLFAMVPLPMAQVESFTFKLKRFATAASVALVDALFRLHLHDYVVVQDGSYVRWERAEGGMDFIVVGDVCSGLRSLIALIAFGALFAYIAKLSLSRKLILFAASVPIALLANMCRIIALTFVACRWGSESAHGWVHDTTGYGIFAVAFVLFFGFERFLRLFEPGTGEGASPGGSGPAQATETA